MSIRPILRRCRHCSRYGKIEGRGLCYRCFGNRLIRVRYPCGKPGRPPRGEDDDIEREAAEMAALPLTKGTLGDNVRPKYVAPPRTAPELGDWRKSWSHLRVVLTPDTSPQAIAKRQREDVLRCARRGMSVEEISEECVLPVGIVKRHLGRVKA